MGSFLLEISQFRWVSLSLQLGVGMQPDKLIPNVKRKPIPVAETRNLDDMLEQQKNEKQNMNVEVSELLKSSNPLQEERAWKRHRNVSRR